jgi:predicted nucleic acid-binding protein
MRGILTDTGPLVAVFSPQDKGHEICVRSLRSIPGPMISCWPVITEAAWLMRALPHAVRQLLSAIDGESLKLLPLAGAEAKSIAALMEKYEDIRPQFADAALVYLAHREQVDTIFTLDRRDFSIYRNGRGRPFHIIPEVV